jgi:hypothetical protein
MHCTSCHPRIACPVSPHYSHALHVLSADLHERVEVAERGEHQTPPSTIDRDVMRQAVGFPGGSVARQREDRALSDQVRSRVVLVQRCEDWSKRLARVQIL